MFRRQKAEAEAIRRRLLPRFFDCLDYDTCQKGKREGLEEATLGNSLLCMEGTAWTKKLARPWIKSHPHHLPGV